MWGGAGRASTEVRRRSSEFICRSRLFSASTFIRRLRASVPVTRHPTSATACARAHRLSAEVRVKQKLCRIDIDIRSRCRLIMVLSTGPGEQA